MNSILVLRSGHKRKGEKFITVVANKQTMEVQEGTSFVITERLMSSTGREYYHVKWNDGGVMTMRHSGELVSSIMHTEQTITVRVHYSNVEAAKDFLTESLKFYARKRLAGEHGWRERAEKFLEENKDNTYA